MSDEEKKPSAPDHFEEKCIVVTVPPGTSIREIEQQIHDALAEQPEDIFKARQCKELVIIIRHEGH
jgi:hypothetical protein